jgi:hypothetical protein
MTQEHLLCLYNDIKIQNKPKILVLHYFSFLLLYLCYSGIGFEKISRCGLLFHIAFSASLKMAWNEMDLFPQWGKIRILFPPTVQKLL